MVAMPSKAFRQKSAAIRTSRLSSSRNFHSFDVFSGNALLGLVILKVPVLGCLLVIGTERKKLCEMHDNSTFSAGLTRSYSRGRTYLSGISRSYGLTPDSQIR